MAKKLLIRNIGELVTCASFGRPKRGPEMRDPGLIRNAAVLIIDGRINAIGPDGELSRQFEGVRIHDACAKVVTPGFVDPHTHIVFAGSRLDEFELKIQGADYLEILKHGGGILSTVEKTRAAGVDDLASSAILRLRSMLECGTTVCEIKTGYGLTTDDELKMLSVIEEVDRVQPIGIVPTFLGAHAVPVEYQERPASYVELVCDEMLPRAWNWYEGTDFAAKGVPIFADVFCEKNAFNVDELNKMLIEAKGLGFRLKAHVDEFTNLGGSRSAIALGADSIDHLDAISDDEIELLAASETIGIVTPTVNFNFGSSTFADARRLIDRGCVVALATDFNPGSAPCPSQPMAMALACRYQKLLPSEALNAATINAAYSIGLGRESGSIEVGKRADMLIFDTNDHRQITYEFGNTRPISVIRDGELVLG